MTTPASPTQAPRTATSVVVTSISTANITFSDGTKTDYSGALFDIVANKEASAAMLHAALAAWHASQVAAAAQSATDAANAAIEPAHTQLAALLANGTPADIATAKGVLAAAMLPAKQKRISAAQAKFVKAQADLAAARSA